LGNCKTSQQKNSTYLAHFPTNLQLHSTTVHFDKKSEIAARADKEQILTTTKQFTSITMGAPSAHSLGFKMGGLRSVLAKVDKLNGREPEGPEAALKGLELRFHAFARESVVVSQALGAVVAAAEGHLSKCLLEKNEAVVRQLVDVGLLVHSVGLLTTMGKEEKMLDDFAGAYENLQVRLALEPPTWGGSEEEEEEEETFSKEESSSSSSSSSRRILKVGGVRSLSSKLGHVVVNFVVQRREVYDWLMETIGRFDACVEVDVRLVLMNLGVNEFQTVANASGNTDIQTAINRKGLLNLGSYHEAVIKHDTEMVDSTELTSLLKTLGDHVETEAKEKSKVVDLLLVSCHIARLLNGARTTSCKSAKDRTSVFHTLEAVRVVERWGWLSR
jgi:hypothetical protein